LPKGAFATTILREIMKVSETQMPEVDDEDEE
jgi:tRNA(Glu) U13 pseudouridine synthase TruD